MAGSRGKDHYRQIPEAERANREGDGVGIENHKYTNSHSPNSDNMGNPTPRMADARNAARERAIKNAPKLPPQPTRTRGR